jgi:hypothetical protein
LKNENPVLLDCPGSEKKLVCVQDKPALKGIKLQE